MTQSAQYAEILRQAIPKGTSPLATGTRQFTESAEKLADDLYRLSIEFGVDFGEFKARVMQEILDSCANSRTESSDGEKSYAVTPMLKSVAQHLPQIIFALELMPEDYNL